MLDPLIYLIYYLVIEIGGIVMQKIAFIGTMTFVSALVIGCSDMQQIPMNQPQTDAYNDCMGHHWSTLADAALFGVAGYEYHQNQVLNCQQVALMKGQTPVSTDQSTVKSSQTTIGSPNQIEPASAKTVSSAQP
jgi:hypothetical protein